MSRFGESTQAVILTAVDRNEPERIDPALTVGFSKERVISTFAEILRVLHVLAGTLALFSGFVALAVRKGGNRHRISGTVFLFAMLAMGLSADVLAVVVPDQLTNLLAGTFALYLVATSWLTVRRTIGSTLIAEKVALALIACVGFAFSILSLQLIAGWTPFLRSAIPFEGPVRIAVFAFTGITWLCAPGDARVILGGPLAGARRIVRHLWRMSIGFTLAVGSAFTNGLPRLLPDSVQLPLWLLFVPQLLSLALLLYWVVRVRFTSWYVGNVY